MRLDRWCSKIRSRAFWMADRLPERFASPISERKRVPTVTRNCTPVGLSQSETPLFKE